jgi:hypothetical protein
VILKIVKIKTAQRSDEENSAVNEMNDRDKII